MAPFDDSVADQVHFQDQDHLSLPIFFVVQPDDELSPNSPDLEDDEDEDNHLEKHKLSTGIPKAFTMADLRDMNVPVHPIPAMQGAFAESMHDASAVNPTISRSIASDAIERRKILLGQDVTEETHAARWRQHPGQEYHELWKLIAQISFGVHLLLYGMAKDEHQVSSILHGHVDEVDGFIQATLEDFDLALEDVDERLRFLKLPLENIALFDSMLEDRQFRFQITNGNEQIEHIIKRTAAAMKDSLKDIVQGLDATKEFTRYLNEEQQSAVCLDKRPDTQQVFNLMKGNADGWSQAFLSLQTKGDQLGSGLTQLGSIVAEMDRRAGDVSRNTRFSIVPGTSPTSPASPASPPQSPPRNIYNHRVQSSKSLHSPKPIISATITTLPASQYVEDYADDRSDSTESEHRISSDFEANSPTLAPALRFSPVVETAEFTLQPRVYTPIPSPSASPKPQERPIPTPTPVKEVDRKSSLRQRFSLRGKKQSIQQAKAPDSRPIGNILTPPTSGGGRKDSLNGSESDKSQFTYSSPDTFASRSLYTSRSRADLHSISSKTDLRPVRSVKSRPELRPTRIDMPPPPRPHQLTHRPSEPSLSSLNSQSSLNQRPSRPELHHRPSNPNFSPFNNNNMLPSPRSETYFSFTPVQANPNSPLQRPWTAAPSPMQPPPSRHAPSTMGMSIRSEMTVMTTNTKGEKVKKKRIGFGWLKKAFSLSEEEKLAFEARRQGMDQDYSQPRETPRFLDGRRIDRDRDGRSIRSGYVR